MNNDVKNTAERRAINAALGIKEKPHYRYNWKTAKPEITVHIEAIKRNLYPIHIHPFFTGLEATCH